MAYGLLASDIKALFSDTVNTADGVVNQLIADADVIVQELLASASLSQDRLKLIEKYLAAHFLCIIEERGQLASAKTGSSADTYAGKFDAGLTLTRFGQQALIFDTSGKLKSSMGSLSKTAQLRFVHPRDWQLNPPTQSA